MSANTFVASMSSELIIRLDCAFCVLCGNGYLIQNSISSVFMNIYFIWCSIANYPRSRQISQQRDMWWELCNHSDIWQTRLQYSCQGVWVIIVMQSFQSRGFKTSRDLMVLRLNAQRIGEVAVVWQSKLRYVVWLWCCHWKQLNLAVSLEWDEELSWWRHQMETFSVLLGICAGNSPVTGEFIAQRPVTRSFDVFFDLRLDKRLCKQSWGWWFETPLRPLWRHCNGRLEIRWLCNWWNRQINFIVYINKCVYI